MTENKTAAAIVTAVEAARPKLNGMADTELPSPEMVAELVASSLTRPNKEGRSHFRKSPARGAPQHHRGFLKILQWQLGMSGPSIGSLVMAGYDFPSREDHDKAESLAVVIKVLLGGTNRNLDAWKRALGR